MYDSLTGFQGSVRGSCSGLNLYHWIIRVLPAPSFDDQRHGPLLGIPMLCKNKIGTKSENETSLVLGVLLEFLYHRYCLHQLHAKHGIGELAASDTK